MLALLRDGGSGAIAMASGALLCQFLLLAPVSVATARLLDSVADVWLPALLLFGLVLLAGNTAGAVASVGRARVTASVDNTHQARITGVTQALNVEAQESQQARERATMTAADPRSWVEKTPGDGAVAQLTIVLRYVGMLSSLAVVAAWFFWLVPVPLLPAPAVREISRRQLLRPFRIWTKRIDHLRRSQYWDELTSAPSEAKEVGVFGIADWINSRQQTHMRAHLDPVWADDRRALFGQWRQSLLTLAPLGTTFCAVLYSVAAGSNSVTSQRGAHCGLGVFHSMSSTTFPAIHGTYRRISD